MTEKRRHARADAAQAAKGRQKPSTPSIRPPIQPEAGTICADSRDATCPWSIGATVLVHLTDSGLMCYEAAGHMLISAAVEAHMCTSLNQLMRIALLLTAIDAALVLFPVTAHAGSGFRRAIDAGVAGAKKVAVLVNIDKTNQQMTVSLDGVETYEWRVSTGRAGYSTPSGTYTATSMNKIWYSKQWDNAPMPHSIFFMKDGHAIHGSLDVKNLGKPVSHGCVRISPKNAATLYALVKENGLENTQVVLTGVSPGGEYKVDRGQTSPRGGFFGRSFAVPYYNGSQGYYGLPWTYSPW